ncbi:hypothetical protein CN203_11550 [Sinorhizobium meliloti]|uniref:hypothetical protein n=1 Tax=Rhizobium meliloti TaxID=382 RepID=UPI0003762E16|nr:hypothetical protein [Sinorhizobium meliloti]RVH78123.1 hypothetical protein CN203_11550 [Sinorhizobium meliloti]
MSGNGKDAKAAGVKLQAGDGKLIIELSDLLPGDILLYKPSSAQLHQAAISRSTNSPYTHAAIYVGDGEIAESNVRSGVKKNPVEGILDGAEYVAVLRSQCGFGGDRPRLLTEFVDAVVKEARFYDIATAARFVAKSRKYFAAQLQFISDNYGKYSTTEEYARKRFICSAFVVACYTVVGIIDSSAQVAYVPEHFSPGHLSTDSSFGWLLGYLVPEGVTVPNDDPCRFKGAWIDIGTEWWK